MIRLMDDDPLAGHRALHAAGMKLAADGTPAYDLAGVLQVVEHQSRPWGLVSVPNALVRGVFQALDEPGVELPTDDRGELRAHISVFRPEEIEAVGGADALAHDRGRRFRYTLGRLVKFQPEGWPGVETCWMIRVHSPEIQALRRSYGLSSLPKDGQYDLHCTVAVRKRGVLGRNERAKA